MEPAVMLVWKLWIVYARMFAVTAILSCVIKIRGIFKSTKWRHFENVKFEAPSARRGNIYIIHNKSSSSSLLLIIIPLASSI